jgi:short subunit fatty acids transporter
VYFEDAWQLLPRYSLKGKKGMCDLPLSIAHMPLSGPYFFLSIFIVENSKLLQQFIEHGVRVLNCLHLGFPLYAKINSFIREVLVFVVEGYFLSVYSCPTRFTSTQFMTAVGYAV